MGAFYDYIRQIRQEGSLREAEWYDTTNEVVRLMYSTLGWLVRDGWERLIITKSHVLYGRAGIFHEHFEEMPCQEAKASGRDECTTFREAMSLIYKHDERVQEYFQLVEDTPEAVIYHINSGPGRQPDASNSEPPGS
jgi:hypothetical protein